MGILTKEEFDKYLYEFYITHYGEAASDEWLEQPAVNVWCFRRENKIITLKSHILRGTVEEQIETITT